MVEDLRISLIDWTMRKLEIVRNGLVARLQQAEIKRWAGSAGMHLAADGDTYVVRNVHLHQLSELKRCIIQSEEWGHSSTTTRTLTQLIKGIEEGGDGHTDITAMPHQYHSS